MPSTRWMTKQAAADKLGVDRFMVGRMIERRELSTKVFVVEGQRDRTLVLASSVEAYLKSQQVSKEQNNG